MIFSPQSFSSHPIGSRLARRIFLCCALLTPLAAFLTHAQSSSPSTASAQESKSRAAVETLIHRNGADVAVAFRALDGGQELFLQADTPFPADTTIARLPVMIELYAEAQARELRLTDAIVVHNHFPNPSGGPDLILNSRSDPDSSLYNSVGKPVSLRELCELMITRKSSLAAALLVERLGASRIIARLISLHIEGIIFPLTFDSSSPASIASPLPATVTARGVLELLWVLAQGKAVSAQASTEMIGLLARSVPGASASQGTGAISDAHHEAMIVYGPHSYVLVIYVRNVPDPTATPALMAQIAHQLAAAL